MPAPSTSPDADADGEEMSEDRARVAISRLSAITTEMAARRELRDRGAEAARGASREAMLKMGPAVEKVARQLSELGRRQREAGGWATRKTLADKDNVMGFGPEEDEATEPGYVAYPVPTAANQEEDRIGVLAEEDAQAAAKPQPSAEP